MVEGVGEEGIMCVLCEDWNEKDVLRNEVQEPILLAWNRIQNLVCSGVIKNKAEWAKKLYWNLL